jgi:hypothetical protein
MNFSLKPHQLVAHWVPGFMFLILLALSHPTARSSVESLLPRGDALRGFVLAVVAFALGELLDCVRDLCENVWDCWSEIRWDFFFDADQDRFDRLDGSYFTYYVFNCNLALSLLYFSLMRLISHKYGQVAVGLIVACVFIADTYFLRKNIAKHTKYISPGGTSGHKDCDLP